MPTAFHVRAASAAAVCLAALTLAHAGDMCPAPPKHSAAPITSITDDHLIHMESDGARVDVDGHALLDGHVKVSQDGRSLSADAMNYDYKSGKLSVGGAVDFEDPKLLIRSDTGTYDTLGGASFDRANFQILDRNGNYF